MALPAIEGPSLNSVSESIVVLGFAVNDELLPDPPPLLAGTVLMDRVSVLSLSEPSRLRLPDGLVKDPDATEMIPSFVLFEVGVNVAV